MRTITGHGSCESWGWLLQLIAETSTHEAVVFCPQEISNAHDGDAGIPNRAPVPVVRQCGDRSCLARLHRAHRRDQPILHLPVLREGDVLAGCEAWAGDETRAVPRRRRLEGQRSTKPVHGHWGAQGLLERIFELLET